jgi:tetratricopeptide (TPR) repeat protein
MKPLPVVLLSVVLSTGASVAAVTLLAPEPAAVQAREEAAVPGPELAAIERRLDDQEELLRDLGTRMELRTPRTTGPTRQEDLETAVRRVLASEREAALAAAPEEDQAEAPFSPTAARDELLALQRSGADRGEVEGFWKRMRENGRMDEVVAAFEEYALSYPNDPEAQIELGNAYLQRLQDATTGPEMGKWAVKADGAFDAALDLDETNWNARFSKAVALSFWPPIFGKQGEAIHQFEVLLDQQATAPPSPDHAQTYVYLGNLYQQQGDSDRAREIWEQGLAAFPEDAALAAKLEAPDTH